jgi:eukaryotic-like serine/threonine-protein kinase
MEYIPPNNSGINSLDGYLKKNPPDLVTCLSWAIQICYGIEYAYKHRVKCHRDIKPNNIMITKDGIAKLTDFGMANIIGQSIETSTLNSTRRNDGTTEFVTKDSEPFGYAPYMSPEQFDHFSDCDEKSDIYSLGILLYQMVNRGKLPFSG